MHPDLEKLISLALADGVVSEKEREIILRKAEKLDLDVDEVEMYLEGQISKKQVAITQDSIAQAVPKSSKREFVPKVVKNIKPAALDREVIFKEKIQELEGKNRATSKEVSQYHKQISWINDEIKILNDEFKKERNIIEKDLKEKRDEFVKIFLEKVEPKLKNELFIGFNKLSINEKNNIVNAKIDFFMDNYSKLSKNLDNFWINYKKDSMGIMLFINFLLCVLILVLSGLHLGIEGFGVGLFVGLAVFYWGGKGIEYYYGNYFKKSDRLKKIFEDAYIDLKKELDEIQLLKKKISKYSK